MVNKYLILILSILLLTGCKLNKNKLSNNPYKILKIIYSKNKKTSIVLVKTGTQSGATVGFSYQFFIAKNNEEQLNIKNRFLWLKGLKKYTIKWTSINTIEITIHATKIIEFKGVIFDKAMSCYITKFYFTKEL